MAPAMISGPPLVPARVSPLLPMSGKKAVAVCRAAARAVTTGGAAGDGARREVAAFDREGAAGLDENVTAGTEAAAAAPVLSGRRRPVTAGAAAAAEAPLASVVTAAAPTAPATVAAVAIYVIRLFRRRTAPRQPMAAAASKAA